MSEPLFTGANHICVVTRDLDRAVGVWADRYGVGPWSVFGYDGHGVSATVAGAPSPLRMRAAMCQVGPAFRVEIIQPLDDHNIYAESLERHGDADHVHHVRLDVADHGATVAHVRDLGVEVRLEARFTGGAADGPELVATYLGTEDDLGFLLEVADRPPGFAMPAPEYVYPASASARSPNADT